MSGEKMTDGDMAGEAAGREIQTAQEVQNPQKKEPEKPKTKREEKVEEWANRFVDPWHSPSIFAFMDVNRGEILEVEDSCGAGGSGGAKGVLMNRNGSLAVKIGNNIYAIAGGLNERRFKWTTESAEKLGGFEFDAEIAEAERSIIASTRGFLKDWRKKTEPEAKVEKKEETFSSLLRTIIARRRIGHIAHVRGSEKLIESIYYRCSEREARALKELGKKEYLPMYDYKGVAEVLLNDSEAEDDIVEMLQDAGYGLDYCMPATVKILKKGVQFFPPESQI